VSTPLTFIYGNCVFACGLNDPWAAFALELSSYAWLDEEAKRARFLSLIGALEAVEADVQILRVSRCWSAERYAQTLRDERRTWSPGACRHTRAFASYVDQHVEHLAEVAVGEPLAFVVVSLNEPERDVASYLSRAAAEHPRQWWGALRRALSVDDRRMLALSELERVRVRADQAHARLASFLPVRQVRGVELQWLVRRAFCRGLGEPLVDGLHEPRALVFERNGEAMLAPLEADVMRWGWLVLFPLFLSKSILGSAAGVTAAPARPDIGARARLSAA
jgi:hypothetical protein